MTQEDKQLLLTDLCARLSYGLIVEATYKDGEGWKTEDRKLLGIYEDGQVYIDCVYTNIENVRPYLRPLSSMTNEEYEELRHIEKDYWGFAPKDFINDWCPNYASLDWLNSHHFDYRGLIEMGLALEAPEDMYNN